MKIYLYLANKFVTFTLPSEIFGSFSFDENEEEDDKLINVEARDNKWFLYSTNESKIMENYNFLEAVELESDHYYTIKRENYVYLIYAINLDAKQMKIFHYDSLMNLQIGTTSDCNLIYQCPLLQAETVKIYIKENQLTLERGPHIPLYINSKQTPGLNYTFKTGDQIEILGLRLIFLPSILIMNAPKNKLTVKELLTKLADYKYTDEPLQTVEVKERTLYNESDYFSKAPRLKRNIETKEIKLSPPPNLTKSQELPLMLTIGPMLTMGGMAGITLINTIYRLSTGEIFLEEVWPSLAMSLIMLISMTLWPIATRLYNKKMKEKQQKELEEKYSIYLEDKKGELIAEEKLQREILNENLVTTETCYDIIKTKSLNFWSKRTDQNDFLKVRIGTGNVPLDVKIEYPEEGFTIEEDNLRKMADKLVEEFKYIENVPIGYSFYENKITAIMGDAQKRPFFINNILVQLLSFYTYEDLKLVVFTTKSKESNWNYIKYLNHNFNNERTFRFFASTIESAKKLSEYLNIIVLNRKEHYDKSYDKSYYLVIVDDYDLVKRQEFFKEVSESENDLGFSLVLLEDRLSKLPSKCNNFINIGNRNSGILQNSTEEQVQVSFINEINETINMNKLIPVLSNVPIEFEYDNNNLPSSISFLEMEKVGKVEQLSILNRWNTNDATSSLKAEIGIGEDGELMYLDLHEKYHGPHGLTAGMTGSGKSELIITYILSMAINYSPDDVAFILIDYKGGGLAFAFSNESTGMVLPHIAGVITNLDEAEINRALASIESETKRRQVKFNEAKDLLSENTLDIYKYQSYYKEGKLSEPIPHLFIVCDEFAELKSQQPEFMDKLISIARIGRSLGIHLILATQKPSGVVNDQIWSNTRFRVCLRVQDRSDSQEMIKRPDAASLKETGRFYLQVGYDEFFALGQSAWTGAPYYESDVRKKKIDNNISFVDNLGKPFKVVEDGKNNVSGVLKGEELPNIMKYLVDVSKKENIKVKQLWLNALPPVIFIDGLKEKYEYKKVDCDINPVIGEYDAPDLQKQGLLTMPITKGGNWIVYGMADSGKEEMINSFVYSCISTYSPMELNLYLLDFGAETLKMYRKAPQVGDVILQNDVDKVTNLWKMISEIIAKRKKLFADYGGDYISYSKATGKVIPNIIVIINGFELYNENYGDATFDLLGTITRDCQKYGVYFVMTSTTSNGIRSRLAQYLPNHLVFQMNDKYDYSTLLSRTKLVPADINGRGLVKLDGVYEFQAAVPTDKANLNTFVITKIEELCKEYPTGGAPKVPVLPEVVTVSHCSDKLTGVNSIPVGVEKDSLDIRTLDLTKNTVNIITGMELNDIKVFGRFFVKEISSIIGKNCYVFDLEKEFKDIEALVTYYDTNILDNFKKFGKFVFDVYNKYKEAGFDTSVLSEYGEYVCVIVGIDKFKNMLGSEFDGAYSGLLSMIKGMPKIHFVIIDSADNFKKREFDSWYKDTISGTKGIWLGNGMGSQYTLKSTLTSRVLSTKLEKNFGYYVDGNTTVLVKFISEQGEEDTYETL